MKFLHSPSSTSTSSTAEARPTRTTFPAVLRRLLCFDTLPVFGLDKNIQETYGSTIFTENKQNGSLGIVGKLMGLDSMPPREAVDNLTKLKIKKQGSSVFKVPKFVELENEKFIILSFEGGGKDKELCTRSVGSKAKGRNIKNQEKVVENDEVLNSCTLSSLGRNEKRLCDDECAKREVLRKEKFEKAESESSDSENLSPVSVFEFSDHEEASYSGKEDLKLKNASSRRKLKGDLDKNAASPRIKSCNTVDDGEGSYKNGKEYVGLGKNNFLIGESKEMCEDIYTMAERDVMDPSRVQMMRWKGEDIEEIGVCFGLQILDQLILELFTIT